MGGDSNERATNHTDDPTESARRGDNSAHESAREAQAEKSRAMQDLPADEQQAADPGDLPDMGGEHDPSETDPPNAPTEGETDKPTRT